jgi:hypothetical protein
MIRQIREVRIRFIIFVHSQILNGAPADIPFFPILFHKAFDGSMGCPEYSGVAFFRYGCDPSEQGGKFSLRFSRKKPTFPV